MEPGQHSCAELFAQLGLAADAAAIEDFIARHRPLPASVSLSEAPFWSAAQAALLRQKLAEDADWAEWIDQLDARLR